MPKYHKEFTVTGSANVTTFDAGLESTEAEKKKIVSVIINVSGYAGNVIEGWIDREKILGIYDYVINTEANDGDTNTPYSTNKILELEVDHELIVGQTFKIAIKCGGTAKNIQGAYKYELMI